MPDVGYYLGSRTVRVPFAYEANNSALLNQKKWVTAASGTTAQINNATDLAVTLDTGGTHKHYIFSVYDTEGTPQIIYHAPPTGGLATATIRQRDSGNSHELWIRNNSGDTITVAYEVWSWE